MTTRRPNQPLDMQAPPDWIHPELLPLLAEPFVQTWTEQGLHVDQVHADAQRTRLAARVAAAVRANAVMHTRRHRDITVQDLPNGVRVQPLYQASDEAALPAGAARQVWLLELAPGAQLDGNFSAAMRGVGAAFDSQTNPQNNPQALDQEWLVLSGTANLLSLGAPGAPSGSAAQTLAQRDYHVNPAGHDSVRWRSVTGAWLFLRESVAEPELAQAPFTLFDSPHNWVPMAPGLLRRVLWQRGTQAALLYRALPGSQLPSHRHQHAEECLMVQGELFLDDVLLQTFDYQLAPPGTGHHITHTDTGVVLYAHGDVDMQFLV